jgi:GNAT superfamily N-acetyltransferase
VAGLGLRHPSQDVGLTLVQTLGDQLVDGARQDLAAPRRQQPLANGGVGLSGLIGGRDDTDFTAATLKISMTPATEIEFRTAPFDSGDGAMLAQAMREEMAVIYEGLNMNAWHMSAATAAGLEPPHGTFLVGYEDDEPICCGGVKRLDEDHCELKRMYVVPGARGRGVARQLLGALERAASGLGYPVARLVTGPRQPAAQHLYESEGYTAIENFHEDGIASFFAEKPLR